MRTIGEIVAVVGILLGLVFVGLEIRQNNRLAQAAAYQAIGIATAEHHNAIAFDDRLSSLWGTEGRSERLEEWTATDWDKFTRTMYSMIRLTETVQIQVEQGLLPPDAMERLGYGGANRYLQFWSAFACTWPRLRGFVGESLRTYIEEVPEADRYDCSHIDFESSLDLRTGAAGGVAVAR